MPDRGPGIACAGPRRASVWAALVLAGLAFLWLGLRMWRGFYFLPFGDETGHLLGARVINGGGTLYRDFIDDHGPVPYALAQAFGAVAGWAHPTRARIIPVLLAFCGVLSVVVNPALRGRWEKLVAAGTLLALLATVWLVQALCLVDYQPMAGFFLLAGLALFAAPAWVGVAPGRVATACGGAGCVLACFVAYAYGPAAILLFASGAWAAWPAGRRVLAPAMAGACVALACMLVWLTAFADWRGYVVFHFIHSQLFYGPYLSYNPWNVVRALARGWGPGECVQALAVAAGGLGMALFFAPLPARRGWPLVGPALLAVAALLFSNPRGSPSFQNGAFVVLAFGMLALALARAPRVLAAPAGRMMQVRCAVLALCVLIVGAAEAVCRRAISTPHELTRKQMLHVSPMALGLSQGSWAISLRRATAPDERFLAMPFQPELYFQAGRLPMRGYYLYLPWDADYARHPWLGEMHDLCVDLQRDPPPVIFYNGWVVWDRYDPRHYMACVLDVISKLYVPAPATPYFFVRRDRLGAWESK